MDEMTLWQAILLGLTQGLAEFLPVSSSGHLVLMREIFGIKGEYLMFDVMLHVGTLFAVFITFFNDLIALFKPPFKTIGLIIVGNRPRRSRRLACGRLYRKSVFKRKISVLFLPVYRITDVFDGDYCKTHARNQTFGA